MVQNCRFLYMYIKILKETLFVKVEYIVEICTVLCTVDKIRWRFCKILWLSHNIRSLLDNTVDFDLINILSHSQPDDNTPE